MCSHEPISRHTDTCVSIHDDEKHHRQQQFSIGSKVIDRILITTQSMKILIFEIRDLRFAPLHQTRPDQTSSRQYHVLLVFFLRIQQRMMMMAHNGNREEQVG
jgi:hypothetical protein